MSILVFDSEGDGFLDVAKNVWCIATLEVDREFDKLYSPTDLHKAFVDMHKYRVLVGHNIRGYDLPLFKKLYNWEPLPSQIIVDTLVLSRLLNPKRPMPQGMPGNTAHSIEAYGYRFGIPKPEHEDWSKYTPEMGIRCVKDTEINYKVLLYLEQELGHKPYWR